MPARRHNGCPLKRYHSEHFQHLIRNRFGLRSPVSVRRSLTTLWPPADETRCDSCSGCGLEAYAAGRRAASADQRISPQMLINRSSSSGRLDAGIPEDSHSQSRSGPKILGCVELSSSAITFNSLGSSHIRSNQSPFECFWMRSQ